MADPDLLPAEGQAGDVVLDRSPRDAARSSSDGRVEYAGLVTRAIAIVADALLIDAAALIVTGAVLLLESVLRVSNRHHSLAVVIGSVLFFVWVAGYFVTFWTTTGQTPGSRMMQVRVARPDGKRIGPRRALVRLGWMVLSLPLFWGYLPVLWTARRRAVFDLMAGTVVETARPPAPPVNRPGSRRPPVYGSGIEPPTAVP
jgi:uncharacterized RDD family membrane protein YckC